MKKFILAVQIAKLYLLAAATIIGTQQATAQRVTKRVCTTDAYGTRTCTEYFGDGRALEPRTDKIMGIDAKKYERRLRRGDCMPSPSGACGGG